MDTTYGSRERLERRTTRGRASREWLEEWRVERQDACRVACANGELLEGPEGGQLVRPCRSCGAPVYWNRDGSDLLDASGGSHFRTCRPPSDHEDRQPDPRHRKLALDLKTKRRLLAVVVPGRYMETVRAFARVTDKSEPQCKRYVARLRREGYLDDRLEIREPIGAPETACPSVSLPPSCKGGTSASTGPTRPRESASASTTRPDGDRIGADLEQVSREQRLDPAAKPGPRWTWGFDFDIAAWCWRPPADREPLYHRCSREGVETDAEAPVDRADVLAMRC